MGGGNLKERSSPERDGTRLKRGLLSSYTDGVLRGGDHDARGVKLNLWGGGILRETGVIIP